MQENYYRILNFLDKKVESNELLLDDVNLFKKVIRDNKYVSTYIRALQNHMENFDTIDDFIKLQQKHKSTKEIEDIPSYEIRKIIDSIYDDGPYQKDPIKVINELIDMAMDREGKLCDFKDSVNPKTKIGQCENDEHYEITQDDVVLTTDEQKIFDKISDEENSDDVMSGELAYKFNPNNQELVLTLFCDEDTNKYDDENPIYCCKNCINYNRQNSEGSDVSCDMK